MKVLEYGAVVEVVFQGTAILGAEPHPMHLHGFAFYTVGRGFGNFDGSKHPAKYNLVNPPRQNTVSVPAGGWAAIRFRATNPGENSLVWFGLQTNCLLYMVFYAILLFTNYVLLSFFMFRCVVYALPL